MKIVIKPRSDQWNADDFIGGPRTFTIAGAKRGAAEQPYDIELVEGEGRAWRPPNGMLSVLVQLWGDEVSEWVGRRVTLFKDSSVRFGPDVPGGIRISHMSDIGPKAKSPLITVSRGKKKPYIVQPLVETAPASQRDWHADAVACASEDALRALYMDAQAANASPEVLAGIQGMAAQFAALQAPESPSEPSEQ